VAAKRAQYSLSIAAEPAVCFDAITDCETFPQWQAAVKDVEVISRDDSGRGLDVRFQIDAKVRQVEYTLRYSYEPPHLITWDYVDGDVKSVDGEFSFEDQADGSTLATYSLEIDPGVWLPGPVKKMLTDQVMKRSVEDLKRRVESDS
jgi:ribosome-associated toxin RatA of RatAB toxin-antitoxin module